MLPIPILRPIRLTSPAPDGRHTVLCRPSTGVTFPDHDPTELAFVAALETPAACACPALFTHLARGYPFVPCVSLPDDARWIAMRLQARILAQALGRLGLCCVLSEVAPRPHPASGVARTGGIWIQDSWQHTIAAIFPAIITANRSGLERTTHRGEANFLEVATTPPRGSSIWRCLCCNPHERFTDWSHHVTQRSHKQAAVAITNAIFPPGTRFTTN